MPNIYERHTAKLNLSKKSSITTNHPREFPSRVQSYRTRYVDKINTSQNIVNHINSFDIPVDISDIREVPQRLGNKAFKITVGKSYVETLKVIWPVGIKVDTFRANIVQSASNKRYNQQNTSNYTNKRAKTQKQPFRRSGWKPKTYNTDWNNRRSNNREWPTQPRSTFSYEDMWELPQQSTYTYRESPYYQSYY